jgi:putative Holliday junction resolvase
MRYLGVDYGLKKIGLAVSEGQIASPLRVIAISSLKDGLEKLAHEIKKEDIQRVVIGISDGKMGKITHQFANELKKRYQTKPVEVIETDETLSSFDAQELMITLGTSQKDRQEEDAYSAMLILQRFLDSLN